MTRKPPLTFSIEKSIRRVPLKARASRNGTVLAHIALTTDRNRYYWYRVNRGPDEGICNTLLVEGSATTFDGCKAEIREYFKAKDKLDSSPTRAAAPQSDSQPPA